MKPRPAGADNFLKWRRTIDEHLELRRMTWDEYAMFSWLCTKASPRTGTLRTSWPTLGEQTGLTANHVEKLCRALKRKRYVWYPAHRGTRGRLVDVAIHKYPLAQGTYTDLSARFAAELPAEVPADVPADVSGAARHPARPRADVLAEVPAELAGKMAETSRGSPPGRLETRERKRTRPRRRRACPARASCARRARRTASPARRRHRHPRGHPGAPRDPALVATVRGWPPESDRGGSRRRP